MTLIKLILESTTDSNVKLNLPEDIREIHRAFSQAGKKLYVVGGAVRDAVLGKEPKDFDLATDAKPDEVLKIAKDNDFHTTEVGKSFGVVIVNGHEIATFRKDIGKGRRPDSVDYTDIEGDVSRRDLTINALFYDIDKDEIVDLVGGIEDLKQKRVRTVGEARERFNEDPLRKLRALRFATKLGSKLDEKVLKSLIVDPSLDGVSEERIRDEFIKSIVSAKSTKEYLELADKVGILPLIFPNFEYNSEDFIDQNNYILLIAYLLRHNDSNYLHKSLKSLKYTIEEANNIKFLVDMMDFEPEDIVRMKRAYSNTTLTDEELLEWGDMIGENFHKFVSFKLTVRGQDVMDMGYKGKDIGRKIIELEAENFISYN